MAKPSSKLVVQATEPAILEFLAEKGCKKPNDVATYLATNGFSTLDAIKALEEGVLTLMIHEVEPPESEDVMDRGKQRTGKRAERDLARGAGRSQREAGLSAVGDEDSAAIGEYLRSKGATKPDVVAIFLGKAGFHTLAAIQAISDDHIGLAIKKAEEEETE